MTDRDSQAWLEIMDRQVALNATITAFCEATDELDTIRAGQIAAVVDDVAHLREGVAALSNRIESLTQLVLHGDHSGLDLPTRRALHAALADEFSVKVKP